MRVIFTGSRRWTGIGYEFRAHEVLASLQGFVMTVGQTLEIVHGDCPEGLDAIVDRWALRRDYEPERHPAEWGVYGKLAGPIRNQEMVDLGADMCLGFPLSDSKGTVDCMRRAKLAGILTIAVPWELTDEPEQLLPQQLKAA